MRADADSPEIEARMQVEELLQAVEAAESVIVSTIERECEALRAGRILAADALRMRLRDAARLYLDTTRAARASMWTIEQALPGASQMFEERRAAFSALLKVELSVLAAERAAAESDLRFASSHPPEQARATVIPLRSHRTWRRRAG
jgi:hypothetical protein